MLCGYEWGYSKRDQKADQESPRSQEQQGQGDIDCIFSNKARAYGEIAKGWVYDNRIIKWFDLFGHKLNQEGLGGDFEKCILQTNWCDTEGNKIEGNYWVKLLETSQVDNFISHIEQFQPKLIFFFGSQIIKILQNNKVLPRFMKTAGVITEPLKFIQKPFNGRKFSIGFQGFENCKIVGLPHPSGTHGLSDDYIKLFALEIGKLLREFKSFKGI